MFSTFLDIKQARINRSPIVNYLEQLPVRNDILARFFFGHLGYGDYVHNGIL